MGKKKSKNNFRTKGQDQNQSNNKKTIPSPLILPTAPPPDPDKSPVQKSSPSSPTESPVERSPRPDMQPFIFEDLSEPPTSATTDALTAIPMKPARPRFKTSPVVKVKNTILREMPNLSAVEVGTNLNLPPSKYLASDQDWNTMFFSHKIPTGFSSFAVARDLEQYVGVTDFISEAENMKRLIKLPFSSQSISLLMHRVGNSILVDTFDLIHLHLRRECNRSKEQFNWEILSSYARKVVEKEKDILLWEGRSQQETHANQMLHKLFYHSRKEEFKFKTTNIKNKSSNCLEVPPDYALAGSTTKFLHKHTWEFAEFSFLLGSNVPCFQKSNGSTVTIRENDAGVSKTVPVLDGIDAWLDNTMLEASETFFCHHENEVVTKTEFVKTQNLEDIGFTSRSVNEKTNKLLTLLKEKISEVGHSYWFYKAPGGDVFEITDLTNILPQYAPEVDIINPIMPAIGTLLYRICETSSSMMPPATVLSMMRHFVSIYPEDKYPLLSLSAIFWVLNSRLNYNMDIYHPEVKLLNGEKQPEVAFEYIWTGDDDDASSSSADIFNIKYTEDSLPSPELEIYKEFNEKLDWDIWKQIIEEPIPKEKLITLTVDGKQFSFSANRSELVCRFFPEVKSLPNMIKQMHLDMSREQKSWANSPIHISTFFCHNAAYTVEIQKPLPLWLAEGTLISSPRKDIGNNSMKRREMFCKKLAAKCTIKATKAIIDSAKPRSKDWIFYLTCKDLFRLFSTSFCLIEEVFSAREKEWSRKKGKQAYGPRDEQLKHDLNKLFREKLALLFLCISYFAHTFRPTGILLGRFCAKWALFLNGDGVGTRTEVTSCAWKIAGDLLATTLGEQVSYLDFEKKLSTYEDIIFSTYPDLTFLCKMSQGNRKIQMVKYLKDYDNFYQKGKTESSMWMAYSRADDAAPDKFKDLVRREIAVAVGEASLNCFRMCQARLFQRNLEHDHSNPLALSELRSRCDEIIDYFDWTLTKWPHKESLTHVVKMKIYQAEVKFFQQSYLNSEIDIYGKVLALEQVFDAFDEVNAFAESGGAVEYISPTVHDEISWRLACIEVEIADLLYINTPVRNTCKLKLKADLGHFERILHYLDAAERSFRSGRCYPSLGQQYIQLARVNELRGLVNYTLARVHGWQPDPDFLHEQNTKQNLHGKDFCMTGKYLIRQKTASETEDVSYELAKTYLRGAYESFRDESLNYVELGCFPDFLQAYLCFIDCRVGLVEDTVKNSIELSLLCAIRNYMPVHDPSKNRSRVQEIINSRYNLPPVIESSLLENLRPDRLQNKPKHTQKMLDRVARRLLRCVTIVRRTNEALKSDDRLGSAFGIIESLVGRLDKGKSFESDEDATVSLTHCMDEITKAILLSGNNELITALNLKDENFTPAGGKYSPSVQGRGADGDGRHVHQPIIY